MSAWIGLFSEVLRAVLLLAVFLPFIGMVVSIGKHKRPLVALGEFLIRTDHKLRCLPGAFRAGVEWYRVQQRWPR